MCGRRSSSRRSVAGNGHVVVYSKLHPFCCINVFRSPLSLPALLLSRFLSFPLAVYLFWFLFFWWLFVTLLAKFFFRRLLLDAGAGVGAGKTLIFQFVAKFFSVIFLLPQFGARSKRVFFSSSLTAFTAVCFAF